MTKFERTTFTFETPVVRTAGGGAAALLRRMTVTTRLTLLVPRKRE